MPKVPDEELVELTTLAYENAAVLGSFAGVLACYHPCSFGACCADFDADGLTECRDGAFSPGGMSLTDCAAAAGTPAAGGTYQGDGTSCQVDSCQ